MTKVYNVWVSVEEIDEAKDENGKDIDVRKLAKFKNVDEALEFALQLEKYNDTPRDDDGFTTRDEE